MAHVTQKHRLGTGRPEINLDLWPKQDQVRLSKANEIFFGGAAGPGKSHLLRVLGIQYCTEIPHLQVYLFRRLFVDIASNHMDGPTGFRNMLQPWVENKLVEITEEEIRWWNGSKIHLCHFQDWKDKNKYQGPEIHVALFDELTHFEERMYRWIRGRNRLGALGEQMQKQIEDGEIPSWYLDGPHGQGKFPLMVSASNPGGIGHLWVKSTFIDPNIANEVFETTRDEGRRTRVFFPATLDDNPNIDSRYEDNLYGLGDPTLVRAMRDGDWDILAGGFFDAFRRDRHVIRPFGIPHHWPRVIAMDWGWHFPFSVGWFAYVTENYEDLLTKQFIPAGSVISYKEWYGSKGKNVGLKMPPDQVAAGIRERHGNDPEPYGWVADQRLWKTDTGMSAGHIFDECDIHWERGAGNPGERKEGWREFDTRLMADPPLYYIFENNLDTIRTLGSCVRSESDIEDIDPSCESHCVTGDTLVWTEDGLSQIKNLVGQTGKVYSDDGQLHKFFDCRKTRKNVEVYEVEFEDGSKVKCTGDHPFLTTNGIWIEASELLAGSDIKTIESPDMMRYARVQMEDSMRVEILSKTKQRFNNLNYYKYGAYYTKPRHERLHRAVWRFHNGDIPEDYHIHHIDGDVHNNQIENLAMIKASIHLRDHMTPERRAASSILIGICARPKAIEWHKSEAGRKWHSKMAKQTNARRQPTLYSCTHCGKRYTSKRIFNDKENHFCHPNCKARFYRRKISESKKHKALAS